MSFNRGKPWSGDWVVMINFLQEAAITSLSKDQPGTKDPAVSRAGKKDTGTEKEESTPMEVEGDDDYEVMNDPEFLQSVLENLPGVDPQSEAIRQAVGSLSKDKVVKKDEDKDKDKSKK
uniref:Uncharacterized protein n=1 Tax=Timema poppense TaxID=170557 RepID=A0A7R9D624_TIMPO|nr:unnamed protein product [Timema poppensis]